MRSFTADGVASTIQVRVFDSPSAVFTDGMGTVRMDRVMTTSTRAQAATFSTPPKNLSTPFTGVTSVTLRMLLPAMTPSHCPITRHSKRSPIAVGSIHCGLTAATASGTSHAAAHTPSANPKNVPSVVKNPLRKPIRKYSTRMMGIIMSRGLRLANTSVPLLEYKEIMNDGVENAALMY